MDNPLIFKLLEEILLQCRQAQHAAKSIAAETTMNQPELAVFYAEAFLTRAANVSRLLWPENPEFDERGEKLRAELQVDPDPELALAEYRAQAAAYDANLIAWAKTSEHRDFVSVNLMPLGTLDGFKEDQFHRNLDPETLRYSFEGITMNLRQLQKELQKIERQAQNWLKLHNPW
ncbi:MAG: hypothetical protein ACI9VS_000508 [Candidatus Binatia bacterium]|jgi:hypothetical protein